MEKTQYFTAANINAKTDRMFKDLKQRVELHTDKLNIDKSALLILDMQRFFFDAKSHAFMPSASAIIRPILKLSDLYIRNNRPIILTRHINTSENAKMMDYWWRDILTEESPFSELIPEIADIRNVTKIIQKAQYDAFHETDLNNALTELNIEQLVIVGVITHLCCETTARSAFVHGYNVFFPIDGTATYNADIHQSTLINLAHGFANITTIEKLNDQIVR